MKNRGRIYIDMDDTICDFFGAAATAVIKTPEIAYPQSQYGFFTNLRPISGAVGAVLLLSKSYDIWFATRPSYENPLCYTEKRVWIEKHFGLEWCKKLIIIPDKSLLKGDILIDDTIWSGFEGEQIHFGTAEFPNWEAVLRRLFYN